jgi:hypothetical protein
VKEVFRVGSARLFVLVRILLDGETKTSQQCCRRRKKCISLRHGFLTTTGRGLLSFLHFSQKEPPLFLSCLGSHFSDSAFGLEQREESERQTERPLKKSLPTQERY